MAEIKLTPQQNISYIGDGQEKIIRAEASIPIVLVSYVPPEKNQVDIELDTERKLKNVVIADFDVERKISQAAVVDFDTERKIIPSKTVDFDAERKIVNSVIVDFDVERKIERQNLKLIDENIDLVRRITRTVEIDFDIQRRIVNPVILDYDTERQIQNASLPWRYENYGTADLLTIAGTTVTNLPESQSRTGSAFYQPTRAKCFDIPATKEIWIKCDIFVASDTVSNRIRIYSEDAHGVNGWATPQSSITSQYQYWHNGTSILGGYRISNATDGVGYQTFFLHMKSGVTDGFVEFYFWRPSSTTYRKFTGDVNSGDDFENVYIQMEGSQIFVSNLIISNVEIGVDENVTPIGFLYHWDFDTERILQNIRYEAILTAATKVLLHFDDDNEPFRDECGNKWTAYGNPTIGADNAKFGKALQLNGEDQYLELDGTIELGGKDFTIAGWLYVPAEETVFDNDRKYANLFRIGDLLWFGFGDVTTGDWYLSLAAYFNVRADATAESFKGQNTEVNPGGRLLHFEIDYQYFQKKSIIFVDGVKVYQWTDALQYLRKSFSINIGVLKYNTGKALFFKAVLDEFRILDGIALHTENFTPPTAPYQLTKRELDLLFDTARKLKNIITADFDTERKISQPVEFDLERKIVQSVAMDLDTDRKIVASVNLLCDAERKIVHKLIMTPSENGVFTDSVNTTGVQSIQIDLAAQQLTDRFSYTSINQAEIMQQVKGQYLDYKFDMRIESLVQRGILTTCQCCIDVDELLFTQLNYNIPEVSWSDQQWHENKTEDTDTQTTMPTPGKWEESGAGYFSPGTKVYHYPEKTEETADKQPKALASVHAKAIADALGKNLVIQIDDFTSTVDVESAGETYHDLLSAIFGWTARLPHKMINCYFRDDKLFVIQRGHEDLENLVILSAHKHTEPIIQQKIMRTYWANTPYTKTETRTYEFWNWRFADSGEEEPSEDTPQKNNSYSFDSDGLISRTVLRTNDHSRTETTYEYTTLPSGRKFLHREVTKVYEYEVLVDMQTIEHTPLGQGQSHSYATGSDGDYLGSNVGRSKGNDKRTNNGSGNPWATWSQLGGGSEQRTIPGITLFDTSFPVYGEEKLIEITEDIKWLNRKTQETISMDVYDCPHVIDFNDKIIFRDRVYHLESNTVVKTPRIVNKQSIQIVRWF